MVHAGVYSSVIHYLKAVEAMKNDADGAAVVAKMKEMPTEDKLFGKGSVRPDGRKIHDMYLFEVKKPEESKKPWDYYKTRATIPADEAWRQLAERMPARQEVGPPPPHVSPAALRSAALIRLCQPGPVSRKCAKTSGSRRSETSCLRALLGPTLAPPTLLGLLPGHGLRPHLVGEGLRVRIGQRGRRDARVLLVTRSGDVGESPAPSLHPLLLTILRHTVASPCSSPAAS